MATTDADSTPCQHDRQYYIFGRGISASKSPVIHNTGFAQHGISSHYSIKEIDDVSESEAYIQSPYFGGASITMPYKLQVAKYCDSISEEARIIGAINTLSAVVDDTSGSVTIRRVHGDNTDWSGLVCCIKEHFLSTAASPGVGWVIGAGGAARAALYAMYRSGVRQIFVSNRTRANAQKVVDDFKDLMHIDIVDLWTGMNQHPLDVIIGTIPAEAVKDDDLRSVVWNEAGGLCIDMSYKPLVTPLLRSAQRQAPKWKTLNGVDVLLEQGYLQFEQWTGVGAPKALIRQAVGVDDGNTAGQS